MGFLRGYFLFLLVVNLLLCVKGYYWGIPTNAAATLQVQNSSLSLFVCRVIPIFSLFQVTFPSRRGGHQDM